MPFRAQLFDLFYRLRGVSALAAYREFCARERWPQERLAEYAAAKLQATLLHASREVPYYRALGCSGCIENYPVLSKTQIQDNFEQLRAQGAQQRGSWICGTSGSTGQRVYLLVDRPERLSRLGSSLRGDYWGGLALGDRYIKLWGVPTGNPLRNALANGARSLLLGQTSFASLQLDAKRVRRMHAYMQAARPRIISGFTSTLAAFAQSCLELELPPLTCSKLIVTAENLDLPSRERIGAIFRGRIMERYGCREAGDIAHQCEQGGRHLSCDHLYLEVLQEDGRISTSGSGSLLITKLSNCAMPIVRYEVGDWATLPLPGAVCSCERSLPLLTELSGRTACILRLPSGRRASGHLGSLAAWHKPLRQWQIERTAAGSATYRFVPLPGFTDEHREGIEADLQRLFFGELQWKVEQCESIPLAPSGKHMTVLSRVD